MAERMRGGPTPRANQNGNGAPQLPPVGTGLPGHNQQPSLGSNKPVPQPGVLSFEQARQQQQRQQQQQQQPRDDNWAQPPPHPSDWRALTPIAERSTRDSGSLDAAIPPPLQGPGLCIVNGSPHSSQIQPQLSETSQDLPKLQTDTELPGTTILGEPFVTSPSSHTPLPGLGIGRKDSTGSLGSKPDSHRSIRESASLSRPDSKLDTHASTDAIRPAGGSTSPPLSSPGKESVFSALPSPYSNQPIHPTQSTFSDIPKTPPRSSDPPTFTPPNQKGLGVANGPGSPTPSSSSRFQGAIQERNTGGPFSPPIAATKAKTPDPTSHPQTDQHANSPMFSPTPTTLNSPPTLTHTTTTTSTTSKSEYSGYSGGAGPSPPQQLPGVISSPNNSNRGPHPTPQSQRMAQSEPSQKESLSTSLSRKLEGAKPATQVDERKKERSGDDHDLGKEAGALYYMREIQDASAVPPPKIVGRGQNIPLSSKGRLDSDEDEEPSTEDEPRPLPQPTRTQPHPQPRLLPEPSPLQVRRQSAQAKPSFVAPPPPPPLPASPPQYPTHHTTQSQYQDHGYTQGRAQQPVLAPQPQQPVMSSISRLSSAEGDVTSPDLSSPGSDGNPTSAFNSRRASVIGSGGSRLGLVSRPSGARDLVMKQRGGEISSHSRRNGQPRQPLPPHPESSEQSSQFPSYPTYTQSPHHQGQNFARTPGDTTQQPLPAIGTATRYPANMANVDQRQHYDDNSDALAALTFLERDEAGGIRKPPPSSQETRDPTSDTEPDAYDAPPVHVIPSDGGGDSSQENGSFGKKYRSSFAPSKQASQRLAKSQAQQAAHQVAVHRPGKGGGANGKGKRRTRQDGWAESSDEEEEDEDEDDEDVDSDGDPVAPGRDRSPGARIGQNFGRLSAQGSPYGSTTDLNQFEQGRQHRYLPRPPSPGRGYGMYP